MRIFEGAMAKSDRAIDQVGFLQQELKAFRATPNPYCYINTVDPAGGHYVFRVHPNWDASTASRWAVIIGELVHDLRSALDHLVWQAVELASGEPGRGHAFPLLRVEPEEGFATSAARAPSPGGTRHGRLSGASPDAITLIEAYSPTAAAK